MKIGVMVESFREGLAGGLAAARQVGADGVQMFVSGQASQSDLAAVKSRLDGSGLELAAVCADFGGHGFMVAEDNPARIERSKRAVDEALMLGTNVVTTHIGVVPHEISHPRYKVMAEACEQLARYAQSAGAWFAIETGPEKGPLLRRFIDDIGIEQGLGVNFDPANLVMVAQDDIPSAVEALGPFIVHTHAKDGNNLYAVDPEVTYGAVPCPQGVEQWGGFKEVPLGEGSVPWPAYLAALKAVGFDGYLTIEREVGEDPKADIELAVGFLRRLLAE
ncbi:MAG: sugar phosphate isomerase/epimerase family protein [Planctomycetota bacterium]|jgi:sugar phosphate isomerase/epimerase